MADILLINGEVTWNGDEICIIEQEDAIKEEAYLRAVCDKGESIFYEEYGSKIFLYLGKPFSQANKAFIELEAKNALLDTEKISEVLFVSLQSVKIEGCTFPSVYAKYRCEGESAAKETTFVLQN